jgi:hypothetical protein
MMLPNAERRLSTDTPTGLCALEIKGRGTTLTIIYVFKYAKQVVPLVALLLSRSTRCKYFICDLPSLQPLINLNFEHVP